METFTPEFAAFWRSEAEENTQRAVAEPRESTTSLSSQRMALEELEERITAARSVI